MELFKLVLIIALSLMLISCGSGTDKKETRQNTTKANTDSKVGRNQGIKQIYALQKEKGPEIVNSLNCKDYDDEGEKYCEEFKKNMIDLREEVTWESLKKQGDIKIMQFDCNLIKSPYGKKYCFEYKKRTFGMSGTVSPVKDSTEKPLSTAYKAYKNLTPDKLMSFDCNTLSASAGIEYVKSCEVRKISEQFDSMTLDQILSFDCKKKYSDKFQSDGCSGAKATKYAIAFNKLYGDRKKLDCNVFSGIEKDECLEYAE